MATDRLKIESNVRCIANACRKELRRSGWRAEAAQDIFDSFLDSMERFMGGAPARPGHPMLDVILRHVQAEGCLLHLAADSGDRLQIAACAGNIQGIDLFDLAPVSAFVEKMLRDSRSCMRDGRLCGLRGPFESHGVAIRSVLCCPIVLGAEKIGMLMLINKLSGPFTDTDMSFVERTARPLAVALVISRAFENSRRLTVTDDLTGLYNSRYLKKYLGIDVKRCLRYKKKVSLLFIDVDGFKQVNDTYGHLTGSRILTELGKIFRRTIRETDVVARYGGDEFIIVLPETSLAGALTTAERIRKKVAGHKFAIRNCQIRLTVSLGMASCPRHALTVEGLLDKADAAMYRARESSRNNTKAAV